MKPQYSHKVTTSFFLWFDNYLLRKGEAFSNKTGKLYYYEDSRLPQSFQVFGSPFKQWVTDSSISGVNIPSGFMGYDRDDDLIFDFENGRIIETGSNFATGQNLTGEFAVKDFNIYLSNETEEDIILENKYKINSRYEDPPFAIDPYDKVVPAVFINIESMQNEPFSFGGEDQSQISIKSVVLAENHYQLDGILSIFADSRHENIVQVDFDDYPITEYGDLKNQNFNYENLKNQKIGNTAEFYVENVITSKLSEKARQQVAGDLIVGFIDFDIYQHRFPRV